MEVYQPRFAGLVRCEGTNTTDRELELPTGTGIVIVLEGTYLVTIYECKDPRGSQLPCAATWRYQALPVISQWLTNEELCWEMPS